MNKRSLVSVVDDDESIRESLPDLLRQFGFAAKAFPSAEAFLASEALSDTRCLILDIAMPGMSGPDLQQELTASAAGDSDRFHHRAERRDDPSAAARAGGGRVPVQAVQRGGAARRTQRRASDEVTTMVTISTGNIARRALYCEFADCSSF